MAIKTKCPLCEGTKKILGIKCRCCKGKGYIWL